MENNEKELEVIEGIEEKEIITEEDMDESDPENNENKKYDESRIYYVYEHIRLDKMEPFYIGKGKGERAYELYRNDHHDAITDKYGHAVVIIADNLTEEEAYWLERDTIEDYVFNLGNGIDIKGHNDYDHELPHLTNMDWGGIGGKSGINPLANKPLEEIEEIRRKQSESMKGKKRSEEYRKNISESHNKKVICITTGETFDSVKKASDHYDISKGNIASCCRKERKHAGKLNGIRLQWKYLEDYDDNCLEEYKLNIDDKRSKKVICITTGKKFDSLKDASDHYKVAQCSISDCCRGKRKHAGKLNGVRLQWKYSEEDDNESKAV